MSQYGGDIKLNNKEIYVKARIDSKLGEVLRIILSKLNMTQQELIETNIKDFIIENISLVVDSESDKN